MNLVHQAHTITKRFSSSCPQWLAIENPNEVNCMPDIRCAVSNCSFWGQNNFCQANSIIVRPESQSYTSGQELFESSILDGMMIESTVTTSSETCCQTFRPNI